MNNRILFILGTRPEAIKLKPIIEEALIYFDVKICLTNQHSNIKNFFIEITDQIIELPLERTGSSLTGLVGQMLYLLDQNQNLQIWKPAIVVVHGDTSSSLCGALYAFYNSIKLCHVEAGLRTQNKQSPFPEESNRKIIDYLADIHFAPTILDQKNLANESINQNVFVVGNSIVDVIKKYNFVKNTETEKSYGLVTLHRRENWESIIPSALIQISKFALNNKYKIIYICNKNKQLKKIIRTIIKNNPYIVIYDAMNYDNFLKLMHGADFILTDSGGVQEEAVFLNKPLLIMRESTERQEIINTKCGYLVNPDDVYDMLNKVIKKELIFNCIPNLYGIGNTARSIVKKLYENFLN